jgi:type VI secretion system secreted protein VgrG
VKVQFHWDRQGKNDADSSCWVRVGTLWAGRQWGVIHIPRVGQEVIVDFLEGDPDQPIVVGSVFNPDQMPAYKLPDEKTKSYVKSNTSPGGVGFNEIRLEDKKDKEQVFMHAQRNMDVRVRNDSLERVLHDRHLIVGDDKDGQRVGDQLELVYRDKHLRVNRHQAEQIDGNYQLLVGKGEAQDGGNLDVSVEKQKTETIGGGYDLHVTKDKSEKVDGTASLTAGQDKHQKIGMNYAVESGQTVHIKAGMTVVIEAGVQLSLKVGGNFIDISPAGVAIQGTMVMINSGGAAGEGQGAKPNSPKDAKDAKPTEPTEADNAQTGHKSCK